MARRQTRVAEVVASVVGAGEALAVGDVSVEHLASLSGVAEAAELLGLAGKQLPEEFARTVSRFQLDRDGAGMADRQRRLVRCGFLLLSMGVLVCGRCLRLWKGPSCGVGSLSCVMRRGGPLISNVLMCWGATTGLRWMPVWRMR